MISYIRYNIDLSDGQKQKLSRAYKDKCPINIKLSHSQLTGNIPIYLTQTQINSIQKAKSKGVGLVLELSRAQLKHQSGGFLGALAPLLARTVLPVASKVAPKVLAPLATGALSGLASTGIGKIFGDGLVYGSQLRNKNEFIRNARPFLTQAQINQLNRKDSFRMNKSQMEGGFLPLLLGSLATPLIAPLAGNLIKGITGQGGERSDLRSKRPIVAQGMQIEPPKRTAKGMQIGPPGWRKKKISFKNEPISNHDILKWIDKFNIKNFDGVFNKQELGGVKHSAIINLDDINGPGTHWCCMVKDNTQYIYFDPFGMPPPLEVLNRPIKYNTIQYQERTSVLCGYFCLFFIKKYTEGIALYDILYKELHPFNTYKNEHLIIEYFDHL